MIDFGSGIIINQREEQSNQTDIIIYDNRILPPFIKEQHIGVYPAESVVGVIEVKTNLDQNAIRSAETSAKKLYEEIFNPGSSLYGDYGGIRPLCAVIAFYGNGPSFLLDKDQGKSWLNQACQNISFICLVRKFSWINMNGGGWALSENNNDYEETKRFIAVFLDNLRTLSESRLQVLNQQNHKDWLSIYIRDQNLFNE